MAAASAAPKPATVTPPQPKISAAIPAPAAKPPAADIAQKPLAPAAPAIGAPRALAPAVKPAPSVAAAGGSFVLQIGAYKSQAEAETAWKTYKAKHAALMAGAANDVQQADLGEKGIWYRLRVVGFPSRDVALAMCERLKADGGGCFLGK
jgi:cell division protein FtsN